MTSEELRDETEEVVEEPETVSDGYLFVMDDVAVPPLKLAEFAPGTPEWAFIQAKEPSLEGKDRIQAIGARIELRGFGAEPANRRERRQQKGKQGPRQQGQAFITPNPNAAFMQKCIEGIVGYSIPVAGPDGNPTARHYDPANNGDNEHNHTTYRSFLRPNLADFRYLVEGYLDYAAGLDTPAQEDFEALGNAR